MGCVAPSTALALARTAREERNRPERKTGGRLPAVFSALSSGGTIDPLMHQAPDPGVLVGSRWAPRPDSGAKPRPPIAIALFCKTERGPVVLV